MTRRFLAAYAPATAEEPARWWGGYGPARGRRVLAKLGDEAVEVDVEGKRAWVLAVDLVQIQHTSADRCARLLPAFGPWVVAAPRGEAPQLDPRHTERVYRPQGLISPVVLVDGQMAGVWRHVVSGRRVAVKVTPFARLPRWVVGQLEAEEERLACCLDCELGRWAIVDSNH